MSDRETLSSGTGPVTVDHVLARDLGLTEEETRALSVAVNLLVRGALATVAFRTGRACEYCGEARSRGHVSGDPRRRCSHTFVFQRARPSLTRNAPRRTK